jgi:hypothetical protein
LYVPNASANLISISKLVKNGATIKADSKSMTVEVNGKNAMNAQLKDGLFHLKPQNLPKIFMNYTLTLDT